MQTRIAFAFLAISERAGPAIIQHGFVTQSQPIEPDGIHVSNCTSFVGLKDTYGGGLCQLAKAGFTLGQLMRPSHFFRNVGPSTDGSDKGAFKVELSFKSDSNLAFFAICRGRLHHVLAYITRTGLDRNFLRSQVERRTVQQPIEGR